MRIQGRAGTAAAVGLVLSTAVPAGAEIRPDGLSGRALRTWKAIVVVVESTDANGRALHPTLRGLYREIDASPHVVRIEILRTRGSSAIAGRFWIEAVGADGRHEASITLNLKAIDRVLTGSPDAQLVTFERLGRTERCAQVLGHELAHAAWSFADPERVRLVAELQRRSIELARRARTEGVAAEGFSEAVEENERLARLLEEPALAAEAAITGELRASR